MLPEPRKSDVPLTMDTQTIPPAAEPTLVDVELPKPTTPDDDEQRKERSKTE